MESSKGKELKDKENKSKEYKGNKEQEFAENFLTGSNVVSATEYTGMVTTAIESEEEAENYSEDFNIPQQKESRVD